MVDQASVRNPGAGNGTAQGQGQGQDGASVTGSLSEVANDVATLAELQAKLAAVDLKACAERALVPLAVIAAALAVALGTIPVALLGAAFLLVSALGLGWGWAMLLTAAVALVLAGLVAFVSVRQFGRSLEPLRRSREELTRNIAWVRTVLVYSGRSIPRRGARG
jgi:uncharacterized membrane protein YqjE